MISLKEKHILYNLFKEGYRFEDWMHEGYVDFNLACEEDLLCDIEPRAL